MKNRKTSRSMALEKIRTPKTYFWLVTLALLFAAGCRPSTVLEFPANEVELLKLQRHKYGPNEQLAPAYKDQVAGVMAALFGTPDEPAFPFPANDESPFRSLVSLENLKAASGPVASLRDGQENLGLYRKHCANCHGLAGDGAGPASMVLNPYPRDFRLGKFKFKSTPLRVPPTDEDLVRVLRNGIPGTAMPTFANLPPEEIEAIVDYVKYLAIRGEVERRLWDEVTSLAGEPLVEIPNSLDSAEAREAFRKALVSDSTSVIGEILFDDVLGRWLERSERVSTVPPPPNGVEANDAAFENLAAVGKELFLGKANCNQCHDLPGHPATQPVNYDDWTNDWVKTPGIDIEDKRTFREFLKAGALLPRVLRPRNLTLPVYRGGSESRDLYLRIKNGIEGTPMPSSVSLSDDEIWALVAFVRSMPFN